MRVTKLARIPLPALIRWRDIDCNHWWGSLYLRLVCLIGGHIVIGERGGCCVRCLRPVQSPEESHA